jgi:cation:H+ antiporter
MLLWTAFVLCSAVIVYSGYRLSRYGDIIAEKTGMGRTWIGVVLMASVTSLPELVTGLSSVTFAEVPDIAVGDALGSCVFNMLILAVLDALTRPQPLSTRAHHGHVLSAGFGMLMLSIAAATLSAGNRLAPVGWIGPTTLVIGLIYFVCMRMIFTYERREIAAYLKEKTEEVRYGDVTLKTALLKYGLNAAAVVAAALFLPAIGAGIAERSGLGQSFVGSMLIAVTTSLPEVVVSVSAVRIDAVDLAIGNLLGSNVFNLFILALDDLLFVRGSLLAQVSDVHVVPATTAVAMTAVAVIGLTYRAEKKPLFLAWDSIGIVLLYVASAMVQYALR